MKAKRTGGSVRRMAVGLPVAGLAVLAAVLGFRFAGSGSGSGEDVGLSPGPVRFIEARLSHPSADRYRPYHAAARGSGGSAQGPSLQALAQLEAKGDLRGLAAAYLTRGASDLAASYLQQAEDSPEVFNDRAVLALSEGKAAEAISLLEKALQHAPRPAQALWNRGLALRELELWALSAEAFEAVAVLGEQGWAEEARARGQEMRERLRAARQGWEEANKAGAALVLKRGTVSPEELRARPDLYRLYLYDAIRAAPDAQRLRELWPVAETLDTHFGGSVLRDALRWAESRDFQRRAPLAALYSRVFQAQPVPGGMPAYLEKLRAAGELDILLGTLVFAQEVSKDVEGYARLAQQSRDPWFLLVADHERAKQALVRGELLRAEQLLLPAARQCQQGTLAYRCGLLLTTLGEVYRQLWRLPEAARSVREALTLQRRAGFWGTEPDRLLSLGQQARLQGQAGLARALLDEALARLPGDCAARHFVRANDALALLEEMKVDEARAAMREAVECGGVQSLPGAMTLADLARLRPDPEQDRKLLEGLEARRRAGTFNPGQLAVASHIEGRFLIEQDRRQGEQRLQRAIVEVRRLPRTSAEAREALALDYASLMLSAGKSGEWARALELFGEEAGSALPSRCLLAVTLDRERTLALILGPDGQLHGSYDERRQPLPEDAQGLVPEALISPLRACEQVSVLARPPLHGRSGLLPAELAWRYLVLPYSQPPPPALTAQRLVVKDVEAPLALGLPRLGAWEPVGSNIQVLSGPEATPSRVLDAMTRATEIEIHAHGLINPTLSDASLIVLSPEAAGRYALTAGEVRMHRLEGRPLITLAACRAAHAGLQVHEPFSLPAAFIEAGARTVLAATVDIPDAEAGPFFLAVQERIRAGQAAAPALRDVRTEWLRRDPASWVRSVLVFE